MEKLQLTQEEKQVFNKIIRFFELNGMDGDWIECADTSYSQFMRIAPLLCSIFTTLRDGGTIRPDREIISASKEALKFLGFILSEMYELCNNREDYYKLRYLLNTAYEIEEELKCKQ